MKRTLILLSLATILLAMPDPRHACANAVSQYKKTSYRDGGVVLRMGYEKGSVLNPGEDISFTYQTSDNACVILFNIDTEGYVHLLAPYDGRLSAATARQTYRVPGAGERLVVSGETGMEFVFALAVQDPSLVDTEELAYLRDIDQKPRADRYRIDGDPFLAANIIAGELVRGISHVEGVFLDYVYFFVNERVDRPCYLCGECDGDVNSADCAGYEFAADLDRTAPLTYPLSRAFEMAGRDAPVGGDMRAVYNDDADKDDRVNITFYPYASEVRYVTHPWVYSYDPWYWDDPFWYDPWYCGWVYYPTWNYPYYRNYWGWSFWSGGWGGYYCSGWYSPRYHHWYDYYHDNYYAYRHTGYKTAYKARSQTLYKGSSSPLVTARTEAVKRNDRLRIASSNLQRSTTKTRPGAQYDRSRTTTDTRTTAFRQTKPTRVYTPRTGRDIVTYRGGERTKSQSYNPGNTRTTSKGTRSSTTYRSPMTGKSRSSQPAVDRGRATSRSKSSGSYRSSTSSRGSKGTSKSSGSAIERSSSTPKASSGSSSRNSSNKSTSKSSGRSTSKGKKK